MFSQTSEYAIRALTILARYPLDQFVLVGTLGRERRAAAPLPEQDPPEPGADANPGIAQGEPRAASGWPAAPTRVTLFEVVNAIENLSQTRRCLMGQAECSDERACPLHEFWVTQTNRYMETLHTTSPGRNPCASRRKLQDKRAQLAGRLTSAHRPPPLRNASIEAASPLTGRGCFRLQVNAKDAGKRRRPEQPLLRPSGLEDALAGRAGEAVEEEIEVELMLAEGDDGDTAGDEVGDQFAGLAEVALNADQQMAAVGVGGLPPGGAADKMVSIWALGWPLTSHSRMREPLRRRETSPVVASAGHPTAVHHADPAAQADHVGQQYENEPVDGRPTADRRCRAVRPDRRDARRQVPGRSWPRRVARRLTGPASSSASQRPAGGPPRKRLRGHPQVDAANPYGGHRLISIAGDPGDPGEPVADFTALGVPIIAFREHQLDLDLLLDRLAARPAKASPAQGQPPAPALPSRPGAYAPNINSPARSGRGRLD